MSRLTDAEYQDAYIETLRCLTDAGRDVGIPYTDGAGVRYCTVDDKELNDRDVISAWWSEHVTRQIFDGR